MLHGRQLFKMNLRPTEENILLHINLIRHWPILIMIKNKHTHAMSFKYSNSNLNKPHTVKLRLKCAGKYLYI